MPDNRASVPMLFRLDEPTARSIRTVGALSAVGLSFVLAIVLGFGLGYLLDGWLGTSPWLSVVFFFFGLAAGILNVFRTVARAMGSSKRS